MKLFLVSPQDGFGDNVEESIREKFPDKYIRLDGRESSLWIIAAPRNKTPADIADALNMVKTRQENPNHGLVVQISDYYGHDSKALWQRLEVWLDE